MESSDASALLLLDLPQQALAGIDLLTFTTTPRFKGVRSLPPGFHFTFVGSSTVFSERHGIWFYVEPPAPSRPASISIAKWNTSSEILEPVTDQAELLHWRANIGRIWKKGLTPYRQTTSSSSKDDGTQEDLIEWPVLTSHITQALLSRILGSSSWTLSSSSSAKQDLDTIPGLSSTSAPSMEANLNFLPINLKQTWPDGATGRERTDAAQDRSWALAHLGSEDEIVGELQFCFLMVLTLNNFSCLEQWKRILGLVFTCQTAITTRSGLFVQVIRTLRVQLQSCRLADNGLIDLADEGGSLLKSLLVRFRKELESISGLEAQQVVDELDDLEEYLRAEHGWQFGGAFAKSGTLELEDGEQVRMDTTAFDEDDETGEYAPQIVDLTPEQARLLNVGGAEELHHHVGKVALGKQETVSSSDEEEEEDAGTGNQQRTASGEDSIGHASQDEESEAEDLEDMDTRF